MTAFQTKFGLLLGFIGMCLFAGTCRRHDSRYPDSTHLTVARAMIAGLAALAVLIAQQRTKLRSTHRIGISYFEAMPF